MNAAEITAALRAETVAKLDAAIADAELHLAHLPDDVREAILAQVRTALDAQLAQLECQWAAFDHLLATGRLPAEGRWRPLIALATTLREPGEPLQ